MPTGSLPAGCDDHVQIEPYQEGEKRGIQIWALQNGEKIGTEPIKTLF